MHKALYYQPSEDKKARCLLCPHQCRIAPGKIGICRQRKNVDGILYSLNYGKVVSLNLDPMEKKPLYHFYPGERILSIGTNGCNLGCLFCQNWSISQEDSPSVAFGAAEGEPRPDNGREPRPRGREEIAPEEIIKLTGRYRTRFLAYTYNEPLIWYEYILETAKLAKSAGLINVLVTNGYINREPLMELLPYISAMNIDLKSIKEDFYHRLCKAELQPVLETAKLSRQEGVFIEITNLIIPNENDTIEECEEMAKWVEHNLGKDTPLHFSAYFPAYKLTNPPTPVETLIKAYHIARKHLYFVYIGNVGPGGEGTDTFCFQCDNKLIERTGYEVKIVGLTEQGLCTRCATKNNILV
ncbi:MAG: AmmeMemoRadiSam system radical SAM enzyme [Planctomycetota bacterium]|nr:AmmeMemoRadiSam system radical SAM enzyme [Planctomycetota bacterium]MDI6788252.1 AmmeMemoRadiSam system radical SAM enzyme [Planctomycetota bacterium]